MAIIKSNHEIKDGELEVYNTDGTVAYIMNWFLLNRQQCWENLEDIKETHQLKLIIYDLIRETEDPDLLKSLAQDLTEIEFHLQELWKFPRDANFHRFWEYPKCTCPKLDNADDYPHMQHINLGCPLHGEGNRK